MCQKGAKKYRGGPTSAEGSIVGAKATAESGRALLLLLLLVVLAEATKASSKGRHGERLLSEDEAALE